MKQACLKGGRPFNCCREKKPVFQEKVKTEKIKKVEDKEEVITKKEDVRKEDILEIEPIETKKKKFKRAKELGDVKPLPEDVKEQMVYYIEYNDIQLNKKILVERLNEISKSTKDTRYEYDFDFKKDINIKLEALKTLISELKQKESVIKQSLEEPFIVQRISDDIDTKVFQLENLASLNNKSLIMLKDNDLAQFLNIIKDLKNK